ncbi:hypothetical protein PF008_g4700 [Phytophthora fragariae]|uniref:Uncharacterized protein n=1 Tax=Phytophthora fragariae TaxID=53985 RepID=A0A6G0SC66_9STRA|nr:hypothetical protein PF008_g4700 [Phytophthora fragariae]
MSTAFELKVVTLVLRPHASVAALPHLGPLISSFLGPSRCLLLCEACTFGSTALLDWVWHSSCTSVKDTRPSSWSLCNSLRTEPLYSQWQFLEGLKVAAERGDVPMVKWFFDRFSGLEVPSEVATKAAGKGHLPVLQFLLEHDEGRDYQHEQVEVELEEDSWTDSVPVMPESWRGPGNVVRWGGHATREAVRGKHFDAVRWLQLHTPYVNDEVELAGILRVAANGGSVAFAETMLPRGAVVVNYLLDTTESDGVQWLLDNKYIKRFQSKSASTFPTLAREGNLDLMQQVARLHDKKRLTRDWIDKWEWAMEIAARRGDLSMVKWMVEHRTGREVLKRVKDNNVFVMTDMPRSAAEGGHIGVLENLFERGWEDEYASTLESAAAGGHLESEGCTPEALKYAIGNGHLRVAYWLRSLERYPFNKFPENNRLWHYPANSFDVVLFLQANYPQFFTPEFARGTKSDIARENTRQSDLLVVQWLDEKYPGAPTERGQGVFWPLM